MIDEQSLLPSYLDVTLGYTINKNVPKYFKASKAVKDPGKRTLCTDDHLTLIVSYVQAKTVDTIADQRNVGAPGASSMGICVNMVDAAMDAEASFVQKSLARTGSESLSKESSQGPKSRKTC